MSSIIIYTIIFYTSSFSLFYSTFACYLHGTDSGICTTLTSNLEWKTKNMPFCASRINYPACIPKPQVNIQSI